MHMTGMQISSEKTNDCFYNYYSSAKASIYMVGGGRQTQVECYCEGVQHYNQIGNDLVGKGGLIRHNDSALEYGSNDPYGKLMCRYRILPHYNYMVN